MNKRTLFKLFFQKRLDTINYSLSEHQITQLIEKLKVLVAEERNDDKLRETISSITGLSLGEVTTTFQEVTIDHTIALFSLADSLSANFENKYKHKKKGALDPDFTIESKDYSDIDIIIDRISDIIKNRN